MKFRICASLALAAALGVSHATVNFPFPQNSDYGGRATVLSDKASAAEQLKAAFAHWKNAFYNESGNIAGVRSNENSNEYFSEGIGYGMLLMVYFSDNATSYEPEFKKLWACYKKFMNSHGLMIWKIGNLSESWDPGNGAALDGDVDAAAALILASYQFGNPEYLAEAKTLVQNMKLYEFEANGLHLPGDAWGDAGKNRKNPGYFDPAYMPLFALADPDNADFWRNTAYDANMKLYETSSGEVLTGLVDDWTNASGKSEDDYFGYDASRAPWRNAKAVCWFGDERALAIDRKMAAWVSNIGPSNMAGPINRSSGSLGSDHNGTFVTSLMTAFVSDAIYQANLDAYWKEVVNLGNENYFNQSLKLLNGLLVSGNMPNFAEKFLPPAGMAPRALRKNFVQINGRNVFLEVSPNVPVRVDLVNLNGAVERNLFRGKSSGNLQLSADGVTSGVYVLRIAEGGNLFTRTIRLGD